MKQTEEEILALLEDKDILNEGEDVIQKVADIAKGKTLMNLRTPLQSIFKKKDIDFVMNPIAHFRIKVGGKTLVIVNKKYADGAEQVVGDIAIGYDR